MRCLHSSKMCHHDPVLMDPLVVKACLEDQIRKNLPGFLYQLSRIQLTEPVTVSSIRFQIRTVLLYNMVPYPQMRIFRELLGKDDVSLDQVEGIIANRNEKQIEAQVDDTTTRLESLIAAALSERYPRHVHTICFAVRHG